MEIFTRLGGSIVTRWGHVFAGITWIGLLYYFNFVQVPSFAQFEAGPRTEAIRKLVPRALWWFRWAAAATLGFGLLLLWAQGTGNGGQYSSDYFKSIPGLSISTGMLLGITMFLNVWLVIWPNQKIVIASAERVAAGGEPDPAAAAAGRKGLLASRTNALLSIPMLWFMVATSHFYAVTDHYRLTSKGGEIGPGGSRTGVYWIVVIVLWGLVEANALGWLGGTGASPLRKPLENHRHTIIAGVVLWALLYVWWEIIFRA